MQEVMNNYIERDTAVGCSGWTDLLRHHLLFTIVIKALMREFILEDGVGPYRTQLTTQLT